MEIDLRTPTIPRDQRIWRLFPGESYQFLRDFVGQSVGYLDVPGLPPPDVKVSQAKDLVQRLAYSDAVRDYVRDYGLDAKPEFDLRQFANARTSAKRTRTSNALVSLLEEAQVGDLVVLPEPIWMAKVWVGRFRSQRIIQGFAPNVYGENVMPSRHIDWLGSFEERTVSGELSISLRHQVPFSLLARSLYLEVFALAYGTYVYGDRHAATIYNGGDYLDADASLLSNISKLAAFACIAVDKNTRQESIDSQQLLQILLGNPPIDYTCSQEADIHSPGFNRYTSGTTVPLVIAALLTAFMYLSSCSTKEEMQTKIPEITYVNSSDNSDQMCNARVSEAAKLAIAMIGIDKTWALCKSTREAQQRGLKSTAVPRGGR